MAKDSLTIVLTFESDLKRLELIEGLTNLVGRECGLNEDELHGTLMSVHECVINTICHGNQEDPPKKVRVTFRTSAGQLEIKVCDEGQADDMEPLPGGNFPVQGLEAVGRHIGHQHGREAPFVRERRAVQHLSPITPWQFPKEPFGECGAKIVDPFSHHWIKAVRVRSEFLRN